MLCTCHALSRATRLVHRRYDAALAMHGLTIGQFSLLSQIGNGHGVTASDLAAASLMDPSTVSRLLRPLFQRQLIVAVVGERDRRVRRLAHTPQGAEVLQAARASWTAAQAQLQASVGDEAVRGLHDLLNHVETSLAD